MPRIRTAIQLAVEEVQLFWEDLDYELDREGEEKQLEQARILLRATERLNDLAQTICDTLGRLQCPRN